MLGILNKTIGKIFGSKRDRDLKELLPIVDLAKAEFSKLSAISNDELRSRTSDFRRRIEDHLKETNEEIKRLETEAAGLIDGDIVRQEEIYREIDQLKKQRNKETEEVLMDLLPEAFAVVK
ncbi:MAG TPA: preprotein translocase subunit SecA, partial [Bacteroidia bacterium]|nr:preprotein translocase subunit SecA [Bacteroidia bacterium]